MISNHQKFVLREVLHFLLENSINLSREDAKQIVIAIAKKKNPYIKIIY